MFEEPKAETKSTVAVWLEARARRHPGWFNLGLVVLTACVTIGLLMKPDYTVVLYQGF